MIFNTIITGSKKTHKSRIIARGIQQNKRVMGNIKIDKGNNKINLHLPILSKALDLSRAANRLS
jgi:hypothetical protein